MTPTIQTFTGKIISFVDLGLNEYDIMDIAHGLGNVCRYSGQCRHFYSVAQHSVMMSYLVQPQFAMETLLHDATEAYMFDCPTPLKMLLEEYKRIERDMDVGIRWQFGLPPEMSPEVKYADALALAIEKPQLMKATDMKWSFLPEIPADFRDIKIERIAPWDAKDLFLARYAELKYLM